MEHLWTPWRNRYVNADKKESNRLFFDIGQSSEDEANLVLARSKSSFALLNRFPYTTGHALVLPYREVSDLEQLSEGEQADLWALLLRVKGVLAEALCPDGYNIGINLGAAAGAGLPSHLHVHLVPRWRGDSNFMTPIAGVRIHPNDLESVYRELRPRFDPLQTAGK